MFNVLPSHKAPGLELRPRLRHLSRSTAAFRFHTDWLSFSQTLSMKTLCLLCTAESLRKMIPHGFHEWEHSTVGVIYAADAADARSPKFVHWRGGSGRGPPGYLVIGNHYPADVLGDPQLCLWNGGLRDKPNTRSFSSDAGEGRKRKGRNKRGCSREPLPDVRERIFGTRV